MDPLDKDCLRQLDSLLIASNQAWLFGAGISFTAGIPLMGPLTFRVVQLAELDEDKRIKEVLNAVSAELPEGCHIEHILSQLGDYAAIAERLKSKEVEIGGKIIKVDDLRVWHAKILTWIAKTIRWGYIPKNGGKPERIGTPESPIVSVDGHSAFVSALFNRSQAGVAERRRAVRMFTINYDTLIEDALSLGCFPYWDGFSGGAVAFRSHQYGEDEPQAFYRAHVIKLHGSIDWHLGIDDRVWRIRDGDTYPERSTRVLIYPQSTKYLATQRDPFAGQFDLFRRALASGEENTVATCGYSFGDDHINQEIELAMRLPTNCTTIIAFSAQLNAVLTKWQRMPWSKRLYVATEKGLFIGQEGPFFPPADGKSRDWWTLAGVTKLLSSGAEACIK